MSVAPPVASQPEQFNRKKLIRYAWLSIAAAIATIALKAGAYLHTGSVGLLSDAIESLVNLAAGLMALWVLTVAARPADDSHHYGHSKDRKSTRLNSSHVKSSYAVFRLKKKMRECLSSR